MRYLMIALLSLVQIACVGVPENIQPIDNFDVNKYLGQWYEIARLDHSFERGLKNVTATYALKDDGGISVVNKGFSDEANDWNIAEGKAYFVEDENIGHLKVSFFGPFYGSYVVFKLDQADYQWAYITSHNKNYLWLLARTPTVSDEVRQDFLEAAKTLGFNAEELIFVEHTTAD